MMLLCESPNEAPVMAFHNHPSVFPSEANFCIATLPGSLKQHW